MEQLRTPFLVQRVGARAGQSGRHGDGDHRDRSERAGPSDHVGTDRVERARHRHRRHPGQPRRHLGVANGRRHVRQPLGGGRWCCHLRGGAKGESQGRRDRRPPDGGCARGHSLRRWRRSRRRSTGSRHDVGGDRRCRIPAASGARRPRRRPGGARHLQSRQRDVAVWFAHRRRGSRPGDGRRPVPPLYRHRRLRQRDQPDDRRRSGARRHRPGSRAGDVRGGDLRRARQPADGIAGRLPDSDCG